MQKTMETDRVILFATKLDYNQMVEVCGSNCSLADAILLSLHYNWTTGVFDLQCVLEHFLEDDVKERHLDAPRQSLLVNQSDRDVLAEEIDWQLESLRPGRPAARREYIRQIKQVFSSQLK